MRDPGPLGSANSFMSRWSLHPILDSPVLVGAVVVGLVLLLFVRPYRPLPFLRRATLGLLRLLVILGLLVGLLRPTHVSTSTKRHSAVLLVLFDQSRSMQLPAVSAGKSRWQTQKELLDRCQPILAEMAPNIVVKAYAYDTALAAVAGEPGSWKLPAAPEGAQTDIGSAVFEAVRREAGQRLVGVVLLGDGVQTALEPRVEIQEAGRELARQGYPLYAAAFGPTGDAAQGRDVAIESLPEQFPNVFVKNELAVRGTVRVRGFVNQDVPVELVVESRDAKKQVVATRQVRARQDNQLVPVDLSWTPDKPGQYLLTLRAAEQTGELVTSNNALSAYATVREGGLRVLYLEGELRQEQLFLRRSINASPDMQLDFRWIESRRRDRWPVDLGPAFTSGEYDVVILGDLDSAALGETNAKALKQAVERGTGLLLLGGYHAFGPGRYQDTPLADVIPVTMGKFERQDFDAPIRADMHHDRPLPLVPTGDHAVTRLAPPDRNEATWRGLPPLKGANKFLGVKTAAGVRVLAAAPDKTPLLVCGEFGPGRVLAFAGDSTWQWWRQGKQAEHKRFWRQAILWLVHREDLDKHDVWVQLRQRRFGVGSRVTFTAGAKTASGDVVRGAQFRAELVTPSGQRRTLRLSADGDEMAGEIDAVTQAGEYTLDIQAHAQGQPLGTAQVSFQVADRDVELANPAADPDQLARLADQTKRFGGRLLAAEQLPDLLRDMQRQPPEIEVEVQSKWQLGDTPTDAWGYVLGLLTLLTLEWALRKKWGLT